MSKRNTEGERNKNCLKIGDKCYDIINGEKAKISQIFSDNLERVVGLCLMKQNIEWYSSIKSFEEYYRTCE